jgi:type II secretory pathway component PulK
VLPYLAALPDSGTPTPLNVNTAPPAVLAAALGVSEAALEPLLAQRAAQPFATIGDFRNRLPENVSIPGDAPFTVTSSFFVVSVRARQGDAVAQARALIARHERGWPTVVWQTLE